MSFVSHFAVSLLIDILRNKLKHWGGSESPSLFPLVHEVVSNHSDVTLCKLIPTKHEAFIIHPKCVTASEQFFWSMSVSLLLFFPNKPFPDVKWGLNITDSKLKTKQQIFLARPSGTLDSRKTHSSPHSNRINHDNIATIEARCFLFYSMPCTRLWLVWI